MSESKPQTKRVLSVGQCCADHAGITRTLRSAFGAEVIAADSARQALEKVRQEEFALILVNRVFDADGASGLELIRALQDDERGRKVPVLLVSNHEDAQEQAVQAGAKPGFGKAALGQPHMLARLEPYLR